MGGVPSRTNGEGPKPGALNRTLSPTAYPVGRGLGRGGKLSALKRAHADIQGDGSN